MGRVYNVIDADGHILEPLDLWDKYIDPKFRDRAPRIDKGENGKERLVIEEHRSATASAASAGSARSGRGRASSTTRWSIRTASRAGSIRTSASPTWMPMASTPPSSIRASGSSPALFRIPSSRLQCAGPTIRWLADYCKPYPDRLFGVAMLPLQSVELAIDEMKFARKELGFRGGFIRPNPYSDKMVHRRALRAVLAAGRGSRLFDRLS